MLNTLFKRIENSIKINRSTDTPHSSSLASGAEDILNMLTSGEYCVYSVVSWDQHRDERTIITSVDFDRVKSKFSEIVNKELEKEKQRSNYRVYLDESHDDLEVYRDTETDERLVRRVSIQAHKLV